MLRSVRDRQWQEINRWVRNVRLRLSAISLNTSIGRFALKLSTGGVGRHRLDVHPVRHGCMAVHAARISAKSFHRRSVTGSSAILSQIPLGMPLRKK